MIKIKLRKLGTTTMLAGVFALAGCSGDTGPAGATGAQGPAGADCTATDNLDGTYTLNCGGNTVVVSDGADGSNGESCSVVDNGDGTKTISCPGSNPVVIADGAQCWDTNQNLACDLASEDLNDDGACSIEDCVPEPERPMGWDSARPISKRVHAVHMGAELNYPNTTVDHSDGVAGRNWQIHLPQDIRNCEVCHPDGESSGTWATNPSRLPCFGCHDSDAAQAHYKLTTWDPTPEAPWSGDEEESCTACHGVGAGESISDYHGIQKYLSSGEFEECAPGAPVEDCGKYFAPIEILDATAAVDGTATVTFRVLDEAGTEITYWDPDAGDHRADLSFAIASLEPATSSRAYNMWIPYVVSTVTVPADPVGGKPWPGNAGDSADIGSRENLDDVSTSTATFTNNGDGTFTYQFAVALDAATANGSALTYDRTRTHRVAVWTGGHEGPTGAGTFDFVPDGSAITETRDIVRTESCQECHGEYEFHGHGGDRLTVEDCSMCHNMFYKSPYNDEFVDMTVMIHKIHAGGELASIPGPDGIVWDDPATPSVDESADNGRYVIYRNFRGSVNSYEWWNAEFPAVIENCSKCHDGSGADSDNWKNNPSRDVCGSCHDTIDFTVTDDTDPAYHAGGAQLTDASCSACHQPDTAGVGKSVAEAHDWVSRDPRKTSEFDVELTVSAPTNGTHFVAGETPVVTLKLRDKMTGTLLDHTTVMQDPAGEGCTDALAADDDCPDRDGLFRNAYLFVTGPRASRNPVLTTAARAKVMSSSTGPFDLSADDATLDLLVDGGQTVWTKDSLSGDVAYSGVLSVPVSDGTFADVAAATTAEIVVWLNGDSNFAARAIAWAENGMVGIRSRSLGKVFTVQLEESAVNTAVFGGDTGLHTAGGGSYYPRNVVYKHTDPAEDDPKAAWNTDAITYTLDSVDDLQPGTYVVSVEIADRGRLGDTNYWTPSVGWATFQVKMEDEEMPVAGNCDLCHQDKNGNGYVLDYPRHHKPFTDDAIDQCAACHNYQPYR